MRTLTSSEETPYHRFCLKPPQTNTPHHTPSPGGGRHAAGPRSHTGKSQPYRTSSSAIPGRSARRPSSPSLAGRRPERPGWTSPLLAAGGPERSAATEGAQPPRTAPEVIWVSRKLTLRRKWRHICATRREASAQGCHLASAVPLPAEGRPPRLPRLPVGLRSRSPQFGVAGQDTAGPVLQTRGETLRVVPRQLLSQKLWCCSRFMMLCRVNRRACTTQTARVAIFFRPYRNAHPSTHLCFTLSEKVAAKNHTIQWY